MISGVCLLPHAGCAYSLVNFVNIVASEQVPRLIGCHCLPCYVCIRPDHVVARGVSLQPSACLLQTYLEALWTLKAVGFSVV